MKRMLVVFLMVLSVFFFGCENSIKQAAIEEPDTEDDSGQSDKKIQPIDTDTSDSAAPADSTAESGDDPAGDEDSADSDSGSVDTTGEDESDTVDETACDPQYDPVFCYGKYYVNIVEVSSSKNGSPRKFKVFEPIDAPGNIPVIHFLHGYQLQYNYYDEILMRLCSHGFVVVSSQSNHNVIGGDDSVEEAEGIAEFISWLKTNLQNHISVTPDFDNLGVAGHNRGGKVTNRFLNSNPAAAKSFFGVDPTDVDVDFATADDPRSLSAPVQFIGESMFLGVEKRKSLVELSRAESLCAFEDDDSAKFYAAYPSPSHHIVAAGVGRTDMLDIGECGTTCTLACSTSGDDGMNTMFIAYTAGLMTAFFNSTLKGTAEYEEILNNPSAAHPFGTTLVEYK